MIITLEPLEKWNTDFIQENKYLDYIFQGWANKQAVNYCLFDLNTFKHYILNLGLCHKLEIAQSFLPLPSESESIRCEIKFLNKTYRFEKQVYKDIEIGWVFTRLF